MSKATTAADGFNLENIGWKYYNSLKKKAVEQEFSWSGLILSLSIAFFIVIVSATALRVAYVSIETARTARQPLARIDYREQGKSSANYLALNGYYSGNCAYGGIYLCGR